MFLSGAPPSVGAERTTKFLALQTPRWPETALPECSKQEYVQPPLRNSPRFLELLGFFSPKVDRKQSMTFTHKVNADLRRLEPNHRPNLFLVITEKIRGLG